jgi:hypothetical protein
MGLLKDPWFAAVPDAESDMLGSVLLSRPPVRVSTSSVGRFADRLPVTWA